jgi:choline-sulfatase
VSVLRKLLDSPATYFILAGLLVVVGVASMVELRLPSRPKGSVADIPKLAERDDLNVIFILIDTLRADHLGSYGYERDTSPIMDFLASTGVRFAHVEAQSSWTKSSMASLWTGFYPRRIGITRYMDGLAPELVMPAERFREAGFQTGGIYRNGWVENNFGFDRGFDLYVKPHPSRTPARFERKGPSGARILGTDRDATDSAMEFIRTHAHERFFLYIHYMDVHQYLYAEESALFGSEIRDAYDNAIHWTDRNVNAVLGTLERQGLFDKTLVVIASDHGEGFYEHGLEGHARTLYREVTETPLILILPFRLEPGIVVEEPVQNVDIFPTVFDLLGMEPLPEGDGRSLVPLILAAGGHEAAVDGLWGRARFSELDLSWGRSRSEPDEMVAVVDGDYRLIHRVRRPEGVELYDRNADPKEQRNVARRRPERVAELSRKVEGYLSAEAAVIAPQIELDEMRRNQLRALGYVDLE